MEKIILIKYGELTTKKSNRKMFITTLNNNIKKILKGHDTIIKQDRVRMFIESKNNDLDIITKKLQKVFGLHGIVICYRTDNNIDNIEKAVFELIEGQEYKTFKVITNRADKRFEIPSMDFNRLIATKILKNTNLKVDVHNPEIPIYIEIRETNTYVYAGEIKGAGGYPVGVAGKGLLMLSGGIDSPVAGYLALKRGVSIECLYFESPPHTSVNAKNKVLDLAKIINNYSGNVVVHVAPFTKLQEEIYKSVPHDYMITIMRRMMYRIAERYALKRKCKIIVNGESIGQVASQTLSSMSVINDVTNMPVIRPVACLDKLEIIDIAKKIDTYETSILPFEDCCTIFLPKHPVINPVLNKCLEYETRFDYETLVNEVVDNMETVELNSINKYEDFI